VKIQFVEDTVCSNRERGKKGRLKREKVRKWERSKMGKVWRKEWIWLEGRLVGMWEP
jgi:hypothetical protein